MSRFVLIRPGTTDFDDQGRIKGTLDIPLNEKGAGEVRKTARELTELSIDCVYFSPCQSAEQTAEAVAAALDAKVKKLNGLTNLDHGLWQGKLIEEVRRQQPKVYRMWQDHPETICPPEGETLTSARQRVRSTLDKLLKKHRLGAVGIVVPEPLASLLASELKQADVGDLWKAECMCGGWEMIDVGQVSLVAS